jgi:hypothetical protein
VIPFLGAANKALIRSTAKAQVLLAIIREEFADNMTAGEFTQ